MTFDVNMFTTITSQSSSFVVRRSSSIVFFASTDFSQNPISVNETSQLRSEWQIQGTDYYQLDVLVEADRVSRPTILSQNIGNITKRFEYTSSSAVGPAYQFQAKGFLFASIAKTFYVEAAIDPYETGPVTVDIGTYWPFEEWVSRTLHVK